MEFKHIATASIIIIGTYLSTTGFSVNTVREKSPTAITTRNRSIKPTRKQVSQATIPTAKSDKSTQISKSAPRYQTPGVYYQDMGYGFAPGVGYVRLIRVHYWGCCNPANTSFPRRRESSKINHL